MKRSELKQLIKEVIQEMNEDWYNMDGIEKLGDREYYYYAKVNHTMGEDDVELEDIEVYDMYDPANENDTVKQTDDPNVLKYFKELVVDEYIENRYDDGTFDENGRDIDAYEDAKADWMSAQRDDY
jgi:hypothetical protein